MTITLYLQQQLSAQPSMPANRFKAFLEALPVLDAEDKADFAKTIAQTRANLTNEKEE